MKYNEEIQELINSLTKYPGVGAKTAERLAINTITKWSNEEIDNFISALKNTKNLKRCSICRNITKNDICEICATRSQDVIMVLEDVRGLFAIERSESYKGVYHILEGVINFAQGIEADDINIESLFVRARKAKEIIVATNPSVEGEITAQYIKEILKNDDVIVTRIAYGLPVGGDLEYADVMTLTKALEGRRSIK